MLEPVWAWGYCGLPNPTNWSKNYSIDLLGPTERDQCCSKQPSHRLYLLQYTFCSTKAPFPPPWYSLRNLPHAPSCLCCITKLMQERVHVHKKKSGILCTGVQTSHLAKSFWGGWKSRRSSSKKNRKRTTSDSYSRALQLPYKILSYERCTCNKMCLSCHPPAVEKCPWEPTRRLNVTWTRTWVRYRYINKPTGLHLQPSFWRAFLYQRNK